MKIPFASLVALILLVSLAAHAECFDYGGPGAPQATWFDLVPDEVNDVVFVGDLAMVARSFYGALVVVDYAEPHAPVVLGIEPVTVMDEVYDVDVNGSHAFLTYLQWGGATGVRVFDITDPATPTDVGDLQAPDGDWAAYLAARGDHLYVSFAYTTFGIVDVSDPTAPVLVGQVAVDHPWRITLDGDLAYVASSASAPVIIDIADPATPTVLGHLATSAGGGGQVYVRGNLAYVTTGAALEILDVTDPLAAVVLGTVALPHTASTVEVVGDVAYVGCGDHGIAVVDVADPQAPAIHGTIDVTGVQRGLTELGDHLIVNTQGRLLTTAAQCPLGVTAVRPAPADLALAVQPNPFNPRTTVTFALAQPQRVSLTIHDVAGRLIRTLIAGETLPAGEQAWTWSGVDDRGRPVPSGVYRGRVQAGGLTSVTTLTLVR